MKQTDFRDVPDELWERMSLFLPRSNEQGVAAASPFLNVQSLLKSSTNAGVDANGHASRLLWRKKHSPRALPTLEQSRCHGVDFSHIPCGIWEKVGVDAQWQAMDAPCRVVDDANARWRKRS